MQSNRSNIGALIGGTVLIGFGLLALVPQVFRGLNWGFLWPFIIIGAGALFFVGMFASGRSSAALAIPGTIISGVGLVLLFQNLTDRWESMSYFWTVILIFVGLGIYIMGSYGEDESQKKAGTRVMKIGFIMFIIFGTFFEMIFSSFGNMIFPVLLILLGGYLVVTRSGLLKKKDGNADSNSDTAVPPVS